MKESIETGQAEAASSLAQALRAGRRVITAEYVPTGARDADAVRRLAAAFPPSLDALVVSSTGEQSISAVVCSTLLAAQGIEPVLTVLTRDRNRIALLADIRGAAMLGVRNVLCAPGDHQSLGPHPEAAAAFDVDSVQLIQLVAQMQDGAAGPGLFVGGEVYPHLRPLELALIDIRKKLAAGAQFLMTQPVFDVAEFEEWMSAVRQEGLPERVAIIASVQPLETPAQAEALRGRRRRISDGVMARLRESQEPAREGIAICAEIAAQLKEIEGVRGINLLWGGTPDAAVEVIARARLAQA